MTEGAPSVVVYESRPPAAWLVINRPDQRNAMSPDVVEGLIRGLERARDDPEARCVVLTGAGDRAFCAGGDLGGMSAPDGRVALHRQRGRLADLLTAIVRHPKPVVARVNGAALAGGFGLMLACDLVVMTDDAVVGTPEVDLGLWPFMVTAVVQRNVPRKVAAEMMLTGRRVPAVEAERWGLANRAVPRAELDGAVDGMIRDLAAKSPLVLALGKETFALAQDMTFEQALAYLNAMLTVDLESEDVVEGVSAFLGKRSPEWRGR